MSGNDDRPEFPDDHPLSGLDHHLATHADHLDAYGEVLADADPEEVEAAMLVLFTGDGTDTLPTVREDVDARVASLYMLGSFIHHVTVSANAAGGDATMEDVARDAIHMAREHSMEGETYGE